MTAVPSKYRIPRAASTAWPSGMTWCRTWKNPSTISLGIAPPDEGIDSSTNIPIATPGSARRTNGAIPYVVHATACDSRNPTSSTAGWNGMAEIDVPITQQTTAAPAPKPASASSLVRRDSVTACIIIMTAM